MSQPRAKVCLFHEENSPRDVMMILERVFAVRTVFEWSGLVDEKMMRVERNRTAI